MINNAELGIVSYASKGGVFRLIASHCRYGPLLTKQMLLIMAKVLPRYIAPSSRHCELLRRRRVE